MYLPKLFIILGYQNLYYHNNYEENINIEISLMHNLIFWVHRWIYLRYEQGNQGAGRERERKKKRFVFHLGNVITKQWW
jgi:hypothetical protein